MIFGKFLYSFRDPKMAYEQEVGYVEKAEKKETFKYLSKYKKARIKEGGDWMDVTMLKYIEEMVQKLNV